MAWIQGVSTHFLWKTAGVVMVSLCRYIQMLSYFLAAIVPKNCVRRRNMQGFLAKMLFDLFWKNLKTYIELQGLWPTVYVADW